MNLVPEIRKRVLEDCNDKQESWVSSLFANADPFDEGVFLNLMIW